MKRTRSHRDLWASLLPIAGAALALAVVWRPPVLVSDGPFTQALLVVLILAGIAAACHRPFVATSTVGLGAYVLPTALWLGGAITAAGLAASSILIADLALRRVRRRTVYGGVPDRRSPLRSLESTGRAILAALAAGGVWAGLHMRWGFPAGIALAAVTYLATWITLEAADQKIRRLDQPLRWQSVLPPLILDAFGWALGGVLAATGIAAGWTLAGLLIAGTAVLALEAARNRVLHQRSHYRARDMERLSRAAKRIVDKDEREVADVAERIRAECERVVRPFWFQFELLAPGSQFKSWWAGVSGELQEGVPEPDRYPPPLPGFHRRATWSILERQLRVEGRVLARIRLWCDPRRLDAQGVELLDRLIPQATASLQRCLAGRESREDALTGAALRRVLEASLHETHARCLEEGKAMAVVLCDLDHFKKINDTWGHAAGDAALVAAAGVLKAAREGALCCRYGGEEFALLLDGANGEEALAVAERIRRSVETLPFEWEGQRVPLTLSAGAASFPELHIKTAAELLLFADEALYEAKRRGRNRVLLDVGQGRYQDTEGNLLQAEETHPVAEPPRIFA
ncbi:MAG TPA: GGDEF domain-containing protein [Thermoanaerobaculia bacterium]